MSWIFQPISTFSLFLQLFIGLIAFFDTINEFHYIIQFILFYFIFLTFYLHFQ